MVPHAQLEINIPNITNNYNYYRSKLDKTTKLLIIVKANAYGHGAVPFAEALEKAGADYLAVATVKEGVELREAGIKLPIMVLTIGLGNYSEIIDYSLEPSIPTLQVLSKFASVVREKGVDSYPVNIALDTGMHRLGFQEKELPALKDALKQHPEIKVKTMYSHLACSEDPEQDEFTVGQVELFDKMSTDVMSMLPYKPMRHILNSAGIERFPQYQFDMVRLGIGIYGFSLVDGRALKPVARLICPILQIKVLGPEDGTVGYSRRGKLGPGIKTIATIPVGYADGINRRLGNGNASFEVNGKLAPTIGSICMDMCMLDITGIEAKEEDIVTIFGERPTAADLAKIIDTIPYEIFTPIHNRVERVVKK